jgi:histidinol-phosphate aminotransferase
MIPIKEYLKSLERIQNPSEKRLEFLRLDKNESLLGFPPEFMETLHREITSDFVNTYPVLDSLYDKIARWVGCRRDNIYITAGSDAAIKSTFEVFSEPGDKIALLSPTYAMFYVYTRMFRGELVEIGYKKDLSLSADDVLKIMEVHSPKLICIANPNSPTGTILPTQGLRKIIENAVNSQAVILLDEAYYLYYPETVIDLINDYPGLIVTRTFSKAMGLASVRLGFAAAHSETIKYLQKVRPMYETNAFAVKLGELVLDNLPMVEKNLAEFRKGKEFLEGELDNIGIAYLKSYTNFILIDVGSFERTTQILDALYKRKILIKGGIRNSVLERYIRVTIGNTEQMKLFMDNFKEVYQSSD